MRIGLIGTESDHADEFLRMLNREERHPGNTVTAIWGSGAERTEQLAKAYGVRSAAGTAEEMLGTVDAVIVGDRHADDHLPHALPFIEAGLPVFVDKPLARRVADAEAMLDAANKSGSLVTSASALRWQRDTDELAAGIHRLGRPDRITATGSFYPDSEHGGVIFYGIHATELALQLAGADVADIAVERADAYEMRIAMKAQDTEVVIRLLQPLPGESSSFGAEIIKDEHQIGRRITLPEDYMAPVLDKFMAMVKSGKASLSRNELMMPVRIMEVAQAALDAAKLQSGRLRA
jgi:predicted dehydrogenase